MNICDTNLFGNGLLYVAFNQDQGKQHRNYCLFIFTPVFMEKNQIK